MTGTNTSNVGSFDKSVYQALDKIAKKYFAEDPQLNWLPQAMQTPINAPTYKKPILGASIGVRGAVRLGESSDTMVTSQGTTEYDLMAQYGDISYDAQDIVMEGPYLAQRKAQELKTWETDVKQALFKGVFTGGFTAAGLGVGSRLNEGIVEQATLVEDINTVDSLMNAAGDINTSLNTMLAAIPFRYRDGRKVFVGMDDRFALQARRTLFRGATNQESELDLWFREHSDQVYIMPGQEVAPKPVISDLLFLNTVAGTTKTEVDTLGTHSRIFMAVIDPNIIEQVYSFKGLFGETEYPLSHTVVQRWNARMCGCVHDAEAVVYSEQITF